MLRLTTNHKSRISNRLAIFAAVLLLVTSLAGVGSSVISTGDSDAQFASLAIADKAVSSFHATGNTKARKNRGFKVSLFLFRNN